MDTVLSETVGFNPAAPVLMHLDLNSCFASVEQQANPLLRGKPVAVAAYTTPGGCILAASVEAKRFGVKTGMRVREGKSLCPKLVILPPDPGKYRFVNRKLLALLREYTSEVTVESIDEIGLNLSQSPGLEKYLKGTNDTSQAMQRVAWEIKTRIKTEIGEWLTVSAGIAPNRYLAKIASGLHKPDGLDEITSQNVEVVLAGMAVEELCGIKRGYGGRLRSYGITTALEFYQASIATLRLAFNSIVGHHWWMRLHGWEADLPAGGQVTGQFNQKSFGHSYALYTPYLTTDGRLRQILCQLVEKMGLRLRANGYTSQGIHLSLLFADHTVWHHGQKLPVSLYASRDLYQAGLVVLSGAPAKPVRILAVSCFRLTNDTCQQLSFFDEDKRKRQLTQALDTIADRWGDFSVIPGRMLDMPQKVLDRIAFGGVAGLPEFVFHEPVTRDKTLDTLE